MAKKLAEFEQYLDKYSLREPSDKSKLLQFISIIKEVDSVIDLSRGEVQLSIIIHADNGEIKPSEIAEKLGLKTRTVIDAVQKLKRKNVLEKIGRNRYKLTSKGIKVRKTLLGLYKIASKYWLQNNLYDMYLALEALLILGTRDIEWYPIRLLAEEMKVPYKKLLNILETFGQPLFKTRKAIYGLEVALTYEGRRFYEELLRREGLGPLITGTIARITFTFNPYIAIRRFMMAYLIISTVVIIGAFIGGPIGLSLGISWIATSLYLTLLLLFMKR